MTSWLPHSLRSATAGARALDLLAAAACLVALVVALETVRGLEWPYDGDHYRDIAQAQTARDGNPLSDPHYHGEWVWYNPLVPWLVAAGSAASSVSPATFHVQGGPFLNLLGPAGFYLLGVRLAGRGPAFVALVYFLFFACRTEPALVCPTYSAWLFVASFAQGLFYLTMLVMAAGHDRMGQGRAAMTGALAGLTFLAHTGPALVLGAIALATRPLRANLVSGAAALVVASPFLYGILGHYRLRIVNPVPMAWPWLPTTLEGFPATLRDQAPLVVAAIAGFVLVRHRTARAWLLVSSALTAYSLAREAAPSLPAIVPTFHFWRYAMSAMILLAGAAVWWLASRLAGRYAVAVVAVAALALVTWELPRYRTRFDFVYGEQIARSRDPDHAAATQFLRRSLPEDAVVLGSRGASLQIIGPSGRKVVAVNANWSNPYIDNAERVADRDAMLEAIRSRDVARFAALADRRGVTHLVGVGADECAQMEGQTAQVLYRFGEVCVLARAGETKRDNSSGP